MKWLILILIFLIPMICLAKDWTGTGLTVWNDPFGWTPPGVPTSSDLVTFSSSSTSDCQIVILNAFANTVQILPSYSGTVTISVTSSLTCSSSFTISGTTGSFNNSGKILKTVDFIINGGNVSVGSSSISVSNNFIQTAGTYQAGTGTLIIGGDASFARNNQNIIVFEGTKNQRIVANSITITNLFITNPTTVTFSDNLTVSGSFADNIAGSTLVFNKGATYTFSAGFGLNGSAGNLITIRSSSATGAYMFKVTSDEVKYVDTRDSNASLGDQIDDTLGGVDSGNNTNWLFASPILGQIWDFTKLDYCDELWRYN